MYHGIRVVLEEMIAKMLWKSRELNDKTMSDIRHRIGSNAQDQSNDG